MAAWNTRPARLTVANGIETQSRRKGPGNDLAVHNAGFILGEGPPSVTVFLRDPTSPPARPPKALPASPKVDSLGLPPVVIGDIHGQCLPVGPANQAIGNLGNNLCGLGAASQEG